MTQHYDIAVIGLGVMGASSVYAAIQKGLSVVGFDQSPTAPHTQGSSHGQTRIIRQAYFEHPDYVPLIQRAYGAWHKLEHDAHRPILYQTGGLMMGLPDSSVVTGAIEAAQRHHLPYEVWNAATVNSRYPAFVLPHREVAVYEEVAGYLLAEPAWESFLSLAESRGATLHKGARITKWALNNNSITILSGNQSFDVDRLVITAGPWIRDIWSSLPVWIERQVPFWLESPALTTLTNYPIFLHENSETHQHTYGFPYRAEEGLKVARHHGGDHCSAMNVNRKVSPTDEMALRQELQFFPLAEEAPISRSMVCLYTNTPDEHFVVGPLPQADGRVVVGAGFSGHGFKFAPIIGTLLIEQAYTSDLLADLHLFSPNRFTEGF